MNILGQWPDSSLRGEVVDLVVVHPCSALLQEAVRGPVGPDGGAATQGLAEQHVDRGAGHRLDPLQLAGCWHVKTLQGELSLFHLNC